MSAPVSAMITSATPVEIPGNRDQEHADTTKRLISTSKGSKAFPACGGLRDVVVSSGDPPGEEGTDESDYALDNQ